MIFSCFKLRKYFSISFEAFAVYGCRIDDYAKDGGSEEI